MLFVFIRINKQQTTNNSSSVPVVGSIPTPVKGVCCICAYRHTVIARTDFVQGGVKRVNTKSRRYSEGTSVIVRHITARPRIPFVEWSLYLGPLDATLAGRQDLDPRDAL